MRTLPTQYQDADTVRTQITLTKCLKSKIEHYSRQKNISLAEFIRQASLLKLSQEKTKKTNLSELASQVIGSVSLKNHLEWSSLSKITKWQQKSRSQWVKRTA